MDAALAEVTKVTKNPSTLLTWAQKTNEAESRESSSLYYCGVLFSYRIFVADDTRVQFSQGNSFDHNLLRFNQDIMYWFMTTYQYHPYYIPPWLFYLLSPPCPNTQNNYTHLNSTPQISSCFIFNVFLCMSDFIILMINQLEVWVGENTADCKWPGVCSQVTLK